MGKCENLDGSSGTGFQVERDFKWNGISSGTGFQAERDFK